MRKRKHNIYSRNVLFAIVLFDCLRKVLRSALCYHRGTMEQSFLKKRTKASSPESFKCLYLFGQPMRLRILIDCLRTTRAQISKLCCSFALFSF